jgi:hypothetical protein
MYVLIPEEWRIDRWKTLPKAVLICIEDVRRLLRLITRAPNLTPSHPVSHHFLELRRILKSDDKHSIPTVE